MQNSDRIWTLVDGQRDAFIALSDRVWGMPETCYTEHRSVAEHVAELHRQGFAVTEQAAGIPTAVIGEAGQGGPVIAILGEYDALPGLSQQAGIAEPRPEPGSRQRPWLWPQPAGLGRNARRHRGQAMAGRDRHARPRSLLWLPGRGGRRRQGLHGPARAPSTTSTLRSPGTPTPSTKSRRRSRSRTPGSISPFRGRAAHAAAAPHLGRSALDALEPDERGGQLPARARPR